MDWILQQLLAERISAKHKRKIHARLDKPEFAFGVANWANWKKFVEIADDQWADDQWEELDRNASSTSKLIDRIASKIWSSPVPLKKMPMRSVCLGPPLRPLHVAP